MQQFFATITEMLEPVKSSYSYIHLPARVATTPGNLVFTGVVIFSTPEEIAGTPGEHLIKLRFDGEDVKYTTELGFSPQNTILIQQNKDSFLLCSRVGDGLQGDIYEIKLCDEDKVNEFKSAYKQYGNDIVKERAELPKGLFD